MTSDNQFYNDIFNEEKNYKKDEYYAFINGYSRKYINTKEFIEEAKYFCYTDKYFVRINNKELFDDCILEFYGRKTINHQDLFNFINTYISNSNKIFIQEYKKIVLKDFHYNIFELTHLYLYNCIIDNKFINILNMYFKNLEYISIENCIIEDNAYLNKANCNITIKNSTIKNSRSLKNIKSDLYYKNNTIIEYEDIKIDSLIARIDLDEESLKELLKRTTFHKLIQLIIVSNNMNKSLLYLPIACPNLTNLEIDSSVYSFDFLYRMNNISSCSINSINDSEGLIRLLTPEITNSHERKRIIKSKEENLKGRLELLEYLNKLVTIKKVLRFRKEEKEYYLGLNSTSKQNKNYIYVYDLKSGNMNLEYNSFLYEEIIFDNRLYLDKKSNLKGSGLVHHKKQILIPTPAIYYRDDIILMFDRQKTKEETIENLERQKQLVIK